jgi:demethylmenaquinone methyltransferase / 2-methoxy-6-polyprenyl-1,4-benzoquinol methylase
VIINIKSSSYQKLFDKLAPHYDIIDALSLGTTKFLRKGAVKRAQIADGVVADLMCGTGNNIPFILKYHPKGYIGLDASAEMMYRTSSKYLSSDKITFVHCNLIDSVPAGIKADFIVCTYGLKCLVVSEYKAFADTIDSILVPGGTVSLLEFRMPLNKLFRFLTSLYVNIFCGLICLVVTGSFAPTRELVKSMNPPIEPQLMKKLLEKLGFDITVEEKWMGSAVFIYGRKRPKNA